MRKTLPFLAVLVAAAAAHAAAPLLLEGVTESTATLVAEFAPAEGETLFVATGPAPGLLSRTNAAPFAVKDGKTTCELRGLAPNAYHAARLLLRNPSGSWRETETASFWTEAEHAPAFTGNVGTPGAIQAMLRVPEGGAPDLSTTIAMSLEAQDRDTPAAIAHVSGAIMADTATNATDAISGATYEWAGGRCFLYECYIYLDEGVPVHLWSRPGWGCSAWLDYRELLTTNGPAANYATGSGLARFSPTYTGWHPVRLYLWNPPAKPSAEGLSAVQYAIGETVSTNLSDAACWHPFLDPGDGSRLRTGRGMPPAIEIESCSISNHVLSAKLLFHDGADRFNLRAYYGPAHAGFDEDAWPNVYSLKALDPGTRSFSAKVPLPHGARHLRFGAYVYHGRVTSWSRSVSLDPELPELAPATFNPGTGGKAPSLSTELLCLGRGNDSVELSLEYGETEAQGAAFPLGVRTSPGQVEAPVPDGTRTAVWAAFVATLPDGRRVRTAPIRFRLPRGCVLP